MWGRLARILRTDGHEVFTPSLTGISERAHLARADVDLTVHIDDVLKTIEYERLEEVVLVGHSYGGMVVTGVAYRAARRIASLVYLDAFVPAHAQALVDLLAPELRTRLPRQEAQVAPLPPQAQGMTDAQELAWLEGRRDPQPMRTFTQPLSLEGGYAGARAYIYCSGYSPSSFTRFAERLRNDPAWRYHELPTHHYPQVSMPRETAALLQTM